MLCEPDLLKQPEIVIDLVAQGIKMLWEIDVSSCPCTASRLTQRLKAAEYNVRNGLVDKIQSRRLLVPEDSKIPKSCSNG